MIDHGILIRRFLERVDVNVLLIFLRREEHDTQLAFLLLIGSNSCRQMRHVPRT